MAIVNSVQKLMNSKTLKSLGPGAVIGMGMQGYFAAGEYKDSREKGYSKFSSGAKAVSEAVMSEVIGLPGYLALGAIKTLPKATVKAVDSIGQMSRSLNNVNRHKPFYNATFQDSQAAYTMRQAGMQMAKASQHNIQQAMLGNEANYMHL